MQARSVAFGVVTGLAVDAGAVAVLLPLRDDVDTATVALVLLLPGLIAALVGGRAAAAITACASALTFNVLFLEPHGTLKIDKVEEAVDFVVFVGVAILVGALVAREARRRVSAEQRAEQIEALHQERQDILQQQEQLGAEALASTMAAEHRAALLRSVSHDLRTPLSTIRAVATDLCSGTAYDDATRAELLDLVADESERLDRLVANLLSLSRVEAGALEPVKRPIDLRELLDDVVARQARLVRDLTVSVSTPLTLPLVAADWTLIEQAVTNLLANAARHAPAGSRILVSSHAVGADAVEVSVSDQGPGIPEQLRDEVFTPFRAGPGSTSSGVGLAIVKAVVEAHGGEVRIETSGDGGTRVAFALPVAAVAVRG